MDNDDKLAVIFLVFVFLVISLFFIPPFVWGMASEKTNQEAIKAGLIQTIREGQLIWIKP